MSASDFVQHTLGILGGMEVIHSYGFLHPWLSTNKILLTKQGCCKLYDFCLKEDAPHVFAVKKSKNESFVSLIAPESLRRNEYFQESDVWSAAVVIWEMLSCGLPPFTDTDYLLQEKCSQTQSSYTWPENFLQFRNHVLFECWKEDLSSRPTMQALRFSFKEIFERFKDGELATKSSACTLDLYEPMKEAASDKRY
ncbi:Macrophage-stimulating protein receptor [Holothuria leucospilota]|uniref:Macrophage-stimulating protein receptor n=1 Tax=Holothuria leucospilota TaxID=206669 RepID=A0A9Q0YLT5_HOLLE|nr:Macrophage-stimulating protein receptor [Holothuria leucospilota]